MEALPFFFLGDPSPMQQTVVPRTKLEADRRDAEARIADLRRQLRRCSPSRYGTTWFADREREIRALEGRLAEPE